jgi:hypothetical protein
MIRRALVVFALTFWIAFVTLFFGGPQEAVDEAGRPASLALAAAAIVAAGYAAAGYALSRRED